MRKQYKLFIVDKSCYKETLSALEQKFSVIEIVDNLIMIEYDYATNSYKNLVENILDYDVSQCIITTKKIINIISASIESNVIVKEIVLSEMLKEETININRYLKKIKDEKRILGKIFDEIKWLSYEEGIDIQSIFFKIKSDKAPIYIDFGLFNNGVLTIDDESINENVISILKRI